MNPNKREYTYVPSSIIEHNRSRIDFFLVSNSLINQNTRCSIPHSLTSVLFDHKPVLLFLSGKKHFNRNLIKDMTIKHPDLLSHVKNAVWECYLQHCVPGINLDGTHTTREFLQEQILTVGRIAALLEDIKAIESRIAIDGFSINADLELAGKRAEINLIFEDAPTLTDLENLTLQCAPDIFFQTLVNCIKNNALSHQASIFKIRNLKKQNIKRRMVLLKQNFNQNTAEILELERVLTNLVESELRDELLHYKKFEHLNNEKITPHFMNLVKSKKSGDSLENLKKNDGTEFTNVNELKEYVRNYYRDIYKQENNAANNCTIENVQQFLGPVAFDPIVVNAKLTNEEREALESDITEIELTQSINNANLSSAPGADGISNRFIKNFWEFFKRPLLKLCQTCHLEGRLPTFLKTANIKLIPKKGDTSKIKNWRPISLLNCFYKIISRVVTTRLRKFMDKMTPICQKGYSGTRYCQEVLISVMDNIERLNTIKKRGCLISLDIKKAFDSLSHSYLNSVYKFYNFGPKLIRWLTILCTNRQACIIIENNITTEFFDLERGNAQGDTISPFLFHLGYQILLFKLE